MVSFISIVTIYSHPSLSNTEATDKPPLLISFISALGFQRRSRSCYYCNPLLLPRYCMDTVACFFSAHASYQAKHKPPVLRCPSLLQPVFQGSVVFLAFRARSDLMGRMAVMQAPITEKFVTRPKTSPFRMPGSPPPKPGHWLGADEQIGMVLCRMCFSACSRTGY
jgi:hypothetical protein